MDNLRPDFDHYHKITGHFIDLELTDFEKKSHLLITCSYYESFGHLCRDRIDFDYAKYNWRLAKGLRCGVRKVQSGRGVLIRH